MKYKKLIDKLHCLKFIQDDERYHTEENTLSHVLQVYSICRKESDDKELRVAALYHDIGKLISHHSHEKYSLDILESFGYCNEKVFWLINNHMRCRWMLSGVIKKKQKVTELLNNVWLPELIHLRRCDAMGRERNKFIRINNDEINELLEVTNER